MVRHECLSSRLKVVFRLLMLRSGDVCFGYEISCQHFGIPLARGGAITRCEWPCLAARAAVAQSQLLELFLVVFLLSLLLIPHGHETLPFFPSNQANSRY